MMVDDREAVAVEFGGEDLLGQRHAHRVADALAQRAGGGFHARCVAVLRVTRGLAVQLAEILEIVDRKVVAREMQQAVEEHGAVPVGEHEAVAVGPVWIDRAMLQVIAPQYFGDIRHAHRGAGVTGFGLFHRVHRQEAHGIGKLGSGDHSGRTSICREPEQQ
ncbi:hypothetical protein D3C85_1320630 [compost metagenome]